VVPYAETVDVSVTGTVVVTVVSEADAGTIEDPLTDVDAAVVVDTVKTEVNVDVPNRPTDVEVTVTREDPVLEPVTDGEVVLIAAWEVVLTYGGITDVRIPVDMMPDEEDTPGETDGGRPTDVVVTVATEEPGHYLEC
jgi:hypothetical protein